MFLPWNYSAYFYLFFYHFIRLRDSTHSLVFFLSYKNVILSVDCESSKFGIMFQKKKKKNKQQKISQPSQVFFKFFSFERFFFFFCINAPPSRELLFVISCNQHLVIPTRAKLVAPKTNLFNYYYYYFFLFKSISPFSLSLSLSLT